MSKRYDVKDVVVLSELNYARKTFIVFCQDDAYLFENMLLYSPWNSSSMSEDELTEFYQNEFQVVVWNPTRRKRRVCELPQMTFISSRRKPRMTHRMYVCDVKTLDINLAHRMALQAKLSQ